MFAEDVQMLMMFSNDDTPKENMIPNKTNGSDATSTKVFRWEICVYTSNSFRIEHKMISVTVLLELSVVGDRLLPQVTFLEDRLGFKVGGGSFGLEIFSPVELQESDVFLEQIILSRVG